MLFLTRKFTLKRKIRMHVMIIGLNIKVSRDYFLSIASSAKIRCMP